MTAVLVQRMVPAGVEMIVGALQDPLFGPLIACGTGGVLVDVLADTAFRLHPLTAPTRPRWSTSCAGRGCCVATAARRRRTKRRCASVLLRVSELVTRRAGDSGARSQPGDRAGRRRLRGGRPRPDRNTARTRPSRVVSRTSAAAPSAASEQHDRASDGTASEPRDRSAPTARRARARVGESEGQSPSDAIEAGVPTIDRGLT